MKNMLSRLFVLLVLVIGVSVSQSFVSAQVVTDSNTGCKNHYGPGNTFGTTFPCSPLTSYFYGGSCQALSVATNAKSNCNQSATYTYGPNVEVVSQSWGTCACNPYETIGAWCNRQFKRVASGTNTCGACISGYIPSSGNQYVCVPAPTAEIFKTGVKAGNSYTPALTSPLLWGKHLATPLIDVSVAADMFKNMLGKLINSSNLGFAVLNDGSFGVLWNDGTDDWFTYFEINTSTGALELKKVQVDIAANGDVTYDTVNTAGNTTVTVGGGSSLWSTSGNNIYRDTAGTVSVGSNASKQKLYVVGAENTTGVEWVTGIKNPANVNALDPYGTGIKLLNGAHSEDNKWGGIASVSESTWANLSGLALYANEAEQVRIASSGDVSIYNNLNVDGDVQVDGDINVDGNTSITKICTQVTGTKSGNTFTPGSGSATATICFDAGKFYDNSSVTYTCTDVGGSQVCTVNNFGSGGGSAVFAGFAPENDGDWGSYNDAKTECADNVDPNSHICSVAEMSSILQQGPLKYPNGSLASDPKGQVWVGSGAGPGYIQTLSNDCQGWASSDASTYGTVLILNSDKFLIQQCNKNLKLACCL